jgi:hypothetical protein
MEAQVDVARQDGQPILEGQAPRASSHTEVFDAHSAEADRRVHDIITANLGGKVASAPLLSKAALH